MSGGRFMHLYHPEGFSAASRGKSGGDSPPGSIASTGLNLLAGQPEIPSLFL